VIVGAVRAIGIDLTTLETPSETLTDRFPVNGEALASIVISPVAGLIEKPDGGAELKLKV
jgi:hypothetical protein